MSVSVVDQQVSGTGFLLTTSGHGDPLNMIRMRKRSLGRAASVHACVHTYACEMLGTLTICVCTRWYVRMSAGVQEYTLCATRVLYVCTCTHTLPPRERLTHISRHLIY